MAAGSVSPVKYNSGQITILRIRLRSISYIRLPTPKSLSIIGLVFSCRWNIFPGSKYFQASVLLRREPTNCLLETKLFTYQTPHYII